MRTPIRVSFALITAVASIAACIGAPSLVRAATPQYATRTFATGYGGGGSWDYLAFDDVRHRLFVSRGSHVPVFDTKDAKTVGDITETPGVHGIAIAQDLGLGFTSNGRDNSVTVFDLATLKTKTKIAIPGQIPDAIMYEPTTKHVLTFNGRSNDATVIDARTDAVVATIALPGRPEFAVHDGNGTIYNNIEDKNEIVAIDAKTNAISKTWPLAPCDGPSGLAIDVVHHRLFVGCSNKLMTVVDAQTGAIVTTVPIGDGSDAIAFDAGTQRVFSSNGGDGTVTVAHEDAPASYAVLATIATRPLARTMALDPITHALWLDTALFQNVPDPKPHRVMIDGSFTLLEVFPKDR